MYRIVTIEDNPVVRKLLQKSFAAEGYECIPAMTAEEGLRTCGQDKPDLIVLDVNLPDGNGIDICKRIKEDPKLSHIPVIILTGDASSVDNKVDGIEAGADDYVLKPPKMKEFLARIRRILLASARPSNP